MKLDRLIGILSVLLQRDKVTAPWLAERFEVSRRTINRDIEALCRAGIPIATEQGANGGIRIMDGYRMDRALLTSSDMQAILTGLRSLDSVSGTNRYAQLMEKISGGETSMLSAGGSVWIDLASWYKGSLSEKIERIQAAIEGHRTVRFRYFSPKGETSRCVEPCYLIFHWASWYMWGWCRERQDFRLFKLNRMEALETGEAFEPRVAPLPDLSAERVFPENYHVKALVSEKYKWRLVEEYGRDSFVEQPNGALMFERGFTDREQVLTWMLSFQGDAELLEPVELRETLAQIGKRLTEIYDADGGKNT